MFKIEYGYWIAIVDLIFIGIAIYFVSKKSVSTARRSLVCGLMLLIVGLGASLYVNFFRGSDAALTAQLQSFLSNFSLITAGVGGNLIAASAVMENQAKCAFVACSLKTVTCPLQSQSAAQVAAQPVAPVLTPSSVQNP